MDHLSDPVQIEALLRENGFTFSKSLGQNFIIDPDVCPQMAEDAIPGPGYGVLEIGPGIGVLTVELAKRAERVVSVELDNRLFPILHKTLAEYPNTEVVQGDIMEMDLHRLISEKFGSMPVVVCANLPYYITSPILTKLLRERLPVSAITVMVQEEAAQRLCAELGTRDAGALTVAIRFYARAEKLFFVPKESFLPSPKVNSAVIRLELMDRPAAVLDDEDGFFRFVKAAFSQRRKTILNSLSAGIPMDKEKLRPLLDELGISPMYRVEQLSMDDLLNIYRRTV